MVVLILFCIKFGLESRATWAVYDFAGKKQRIVKTIRGRVSSETQKGNWKACDL